MDTSIAFIEPLLEKLKDLIKAGEKECLKKSIALFGTESDINILAELVKENSKRGTLVIADLSPFVSLGTQTRLKLLEDVNRDFPFVVLVKRGIALQQLKTLANISTVVIDDHYSIIECSYVGKHKRAIANKCVAYFSEGQDTFAIHSKWAEDRLCKLLPECMRPPPPGKRYIKLPDDTSADSWIDIKALFRRPDMAFFIAYQLGYLISAGYSLMPTEEVLVVGNNNSYVLASFLHQIFDEKELIMLDRVGPYPSLSRTRLLEARRVEGKTCCVIEDVLATGREVDLITLLVFLKKGLVRRIACAFNLELASPQLIPEDNILSLCKPSREMAYHRWPKYLVNTAEKE